MYWWCHYCSVWRNDTWVRIDPTTRAPKCGYCNNYLRERLSDGEYKALRAEHPVGVPDPRVLREGEG